jgi:hypothetical protein
MDKVKRIIFKKVEGKEFPPQGYHFVYFVRILVFEVFRHVFPMYRYIETTLPNDNDYPSFSMLYAFVAGCSSGITSFILTTLLDVIKIQLQASPSDIYYCSSFECAAKVF